MSADTPGSIENNTNIVTGSHLTNAPVVAGSHARVSVTSDSSAGDRTIADAIGELRRQLDEARAALDRRDDETRESLDLATSRLRALEEEMHAPTARRDWTRVTKLLTGVRDALAGLTSVAVGADALWDAVHQAMA